MRPTNTPAPASVRDVDASEDLFDEIAEDVIRSALVSAEPAPATGGVE